MLTDWMWQHLPTYVINQTLVYINSIRIWMPTVKFNATFWIFMYMFWYIRKRVAFKEISKIVVVAFTWWKWWWSMSINWNKTIKVVELLTSIPSMSLYTKHASDLYYLQLDLEWVLLLIDYLFSVTIRCRIAIYAMFLARNVWFLS